MCLDINYGQKVKIATKDITCYKVIYKSPTVGESIEYKTYYRESLVEFNKLYKSKFTIRTGFFNNEVVEQGLHSFSNLKQLKTFISHLPYIPPYNKKKDIQVVKCIIPIGGKYYKGKFITMTNTYNSYASDRLIYKKFVTSL